MLLLYGIYLGWQLLPIGAFFNSLLLWIDTLGPAGLLLYTAVYIIATICITPLAPLAVAAGIAFDLPVAIFTTVIAATLGAGLAFALSRSLFRERTNAYIARRPKLAVIEQSISEQGWKLVFLLRLSPVIPSHILNYLCGITSISNRAYILATLLGKIPLVSLLCYSGSLAARDHGSVTTSVTFILYSLGLTATVYVYWQVRSSVNRHLQQQGIIDD